MSSKVSVIIPCYNGERFIDRCMKSLEIQNYLALEVIVVDDGSTDNSKEKILNWQSKFWGSGVEIKYIYQDNRGPGGAINTGLKHVTGEYLSLLDIDDEYLPNAIQEKAAFLDQHRNVDVVRSNGYIVSGDHRFLFENMHCAEKDKDLFSQLIQGATYNWAGSYMVRTQPLFSFYPTREIFTSRYGQNLQLMLPLLYGKEAGFIEKPHMNYNRQTESLSQSSESSEKKKKSIENARGYAEIRRRMIELIVKDENIRQHYLDLAESGHMRALMGIAAEFHDKELMISSEKKLRRLGLETLSDRIVGCSLTNPPIALALRCVRKVSGVFLR